MTKYINSDRSSVRFVQNREHWNNVLVFRLRDEFGNGTDNVESSLSVGDTHNSVEEVDSSLFSRVVVTAKRLKRTRSAPRSSLRLGGCQN